MIIPLSPALRVRSTELNWQLERLRERKRNSEPVMEWEPFQYYGSLSEALAGAGQREIRLDSAEGLPEAIAAFRRVTDRYRAILDEALEKLGERAA